MVAGACAGSVWEMDFVMRDIVWPPWMGAHLKAVQVVMAADARSAFAITSLLAVMFNGLRTASVSALPFAVGVLDKVIGAPKYNYSLTLRGFIVVQISIGTPGNLKSCFFRVMQ